MCDGVPHLCLIAAVPFLTPVCWVRLFLTIPPFSSVACHPLKQSSNLSFVWSTLDTASYQMYAGCSHSTGFGTIFYFIIVERQLAIVWQLATTIVLALNTRQFMEEGTSSMSFDRLSEIKTKTQNSGEGKLNCQEDRRACWFAKGDNVIYIMYG